jgi:hypothetical protein
VDEGVVVELDERLQRHAEGLAVVQQGAVVVRDAPGPGIEVVAGLEPHILGRAAQLGVGIAAVKRPVPAAGAVLVLQDAHRVAGLVQLMGRQHAGQTRAQHDHRLAAAARQHRRPVELGLGGVAEGGHGVVEGRRPADEADGRQQLAAGGSGGV